MDAAKKPLAVGQARITRILHPTDFSPSCERAFEYAILLQRVTGAEIHVLHVIRCPEELQPSEAMLRKAYGEAQTRLNTWCSGAGGPAITVHEVRIGAPHTEVIKYAKERKIDLVVMGALGASGDVATPLGSTAEKVIQGLSIPVLTLKVPPPAKASGKRCVMCGAASADTICDACKDRVRGEAVARRRK
jgi:nucleotide-binding universal stress UspA family protein